MIFFQGALPYHSFDEYEYFLYARSFAETGSLKTPFLEQDAESIVGQFGIHGPAYALLHGSINLLIGEHWWNIPTTNLLFLVAAILLIFFFPKKHQIQFSLNEKLIFILFLLSYFVVPVHTFSFMQENIHFLFAVIACYFLFNIYSNSKTRKYVYLFICLVLVASVFRMIWIVWMWALLPKFKHRLVPFVILNILLLLAGFVFLAFIHAPYVVGFAFTLTQKFKAEGIQQGLFFWMSHFAENIYTYFRWYASLPFYFFAKYFMVFSTLFLLREGIKRKNDLALGISLVSILQFLALFVLYDTVYWRDVRMLTSVFIAMMFCLILYKKKLALLNLATQLLLLIWLNPFLYNWISDRVDVYRKFQEDKLSEDFSKISSLTNSNSNPIVMIRRSYAYDGQTYLFRLPFVNDKGAHIRYSVYYAPIETAPNYLHDFMIVPDKLDREEGALQLLEENQHFYFYKVDKSKIPPDRYKKIL